MGSQIYIAGTSNNEYILKTMKNIFAKIFVTGVMLGCVLVMPTWAAASNGCDDYDNEYINPEVALCTVHAYNIGSAANPDYSGRSEMQEVIALKTTIIAQQMYKQYEYLEAMIRRLKTQLEKATLTASLQAAGAKSSSDGTESDVNWKDKDRDIFMDDGITNCKTIIDMKSMLTCYQGNIDQINSQSNKGNSPTTEMKKQLKHEIDGMKENLYYRQYDSDGKYTKVKCTNADIDNGCANNSMSAQKFRDCIGDAYNCLRIINSGLEAEKQRNASYTR